MIKWLIMKFIGWLMGLPFEQQVLMIVLLSAGISIGMLREYYGETKKAVMILGKSLAIVEAVMFLLEGRLFIIRAICIFIERI